MRNSEDDFEHRTWIVVFLYFCFSYKVGFGTKSKKCFTYITIHFVVRVALTAFRDGVTFEH